MKQALPCGYSYWVCGALRFAGLAIEKVIPGPGVLPDAVLMIQADVEPDRAVESAMLIRAKPGQLVIKNLRGFRVGEIAIRQAAIGDRAGDPMNQLPHRRFAAAGVRVGPVGDVAVEIFRDGDLGRQRAPAFRHLDVFLLEDDLAAVIRDLRRAAVPFELIERRNLGVAENPLKPQAATLFARGFAAAGE